MSRPLLWLRSWWLSHDKWQVLGLVDPVVNSHLRIVIMTIHSFYIHIISQRLSLSFLAGTVLGISLFISCLSLIDLFVYIVHLLLWAGFVATGFSLALEKKKEMVSGQQCWCYWLHLLSVIFFVWMVSTFWGVLLILSSIYHVVEVHIYIRILDSRQIESIISGSPCPSYLGSLV